MWLFRGGAAAAVGLVLGMTGEAAAQASCQEALPAFTAAMRDGTAEALSAYLNAHGPCFEAPARARLNALGSGAETTAPTETSSPQPQAEAQTLEKDSSCEQYANARSERWDQPLNFRITNQTDMVLAVSWINYEGEREQPQNLAPGGVYGGGTYLTHPFELRDSNGTCVKIILPQADVVDYVVGP